MNAFTFLVSTTLTPRHVLMGSSKPCYKNVSSDPVQRGSHRSYRKVATDVVAHLRRRSLKSVRNSRA